uniref:Pleckstrin homology domain containing B1 n=1 Tax=Sander lucioperca TaxID=283035 RepID=A0A8C9YIU4_SANLU
MLFIAHVGLWRTPSVLKRWKLNWCDLWIDGSLCFYKTDSRRDLEHRVSLKTACIDVRSGLECEGVTPPESNPRENLIVVQLTSGSSVNLCVFTYDPYDDSYQAVPINSHHTVYITPGAGPGYCINHTHSTKKEWPITQTACWIISNINPTAGAFTKRSVCTVGYKHALN